MNITDIKHETDSLSCTTFMIFKLQRQGNKRHIGRKQVIYKVFNPICQLFPKDSIFSCVFVAGGMGKVAVSIICTT